MRNSRESDLICAAWDFFPTICEITGTDYPDGLDGISILPSILDRGKQEQHQYLYWEYPERGGQQAVRIKNWKGLRDSTRTGNRKIMLFNLDNDLTEDIDLSEANPEIVNMIEKIMTNEHQQPEIERFDIFR